MLKSPFRVLSERGFYYRAGPVLFLKFHLKGLDLKRFDVEGEAHAVGGTVYVSNHIFHQIALFYGNRFGA